MVQPPELLGYVVRVKRRTWGNVPRYRDRRDVDTMPTVLLVEDFAERPYRRLA